MFKKSNTPMAKKSDIDVGVHNQIAKGTVIRGDVTTEGVLRIDGTLIGSIDSKGKVVVGPTGKVEGEVTCQSANISGEMRVTLRVEGLLDLRSTGKIYGDMQIGKLNIEEGAIFSGKVEMDDGIIKEMVHEGKGKAFARAGEKTA